MHKIYSLAVHPDIFHWTPSTYGLAFHLRVCVNVATPYWLLYSLSKPIVNHQHQAWLSWFPVPLLLKSPPHTNYDTYCPSWWAIGLSPPVCLQTPPHCAPWSFGWAPRIPGHWNMSVCRSAWRPMYISGSEVVCLASLVKNLACDALRVQCACTMFWVAWPDYILSTGLYKVLIFVRLW